MANARYLLNLSTGTAHDMERLTENCNTDQIEAKMRRRATSLDMLRTDPRFKRACRFCLKPKVLANPEETAEEAADGAPIDG